MWSPDLQPGGITFGAYNGTNFTAYNLIPKQQSNKYKLYIGTAQSPTTNINQWIDSLVKGALGMTNAKQKNTIQWWNEFWDRSYIVINPGAGPDDSGFQVGKNYQYFRYMMACNAKGKYPTRFNGGLFTFDPSYVNPLWYPFTPDFRKWSGGTFTAQNQRLLYWPLLKTGDYDIMERKSSF